MELLHPYSVFDVVAVSVCASLVFAMIRRLFLRSKVTILSGPKRPNWLWGYNRMLISGTSGDYFEDWQKQYGDVYRIPTAAGAERTVIMDSRAIGYILNTNAYNFVRHEGNRRSIRRMLGGGILTVEGKCFQAINVNYSHHEHRKAMSPGFTIASIRFFTTIFTDATHKVREQWLAKMADSKDKEIVLDIEHWMNAISFESIGEAGFSHDFDCINDEVSTIGTAFTSLGSTSGNLASAIVLALVQAFPIVASLPLARNKAMDNLHFLMQDVAKSVTKERKTMSSEVSDDRRSLVASIIKAENRNLSEDEVIAQINTLLLAGFETTSTTMAWCLHELSINPRVQNKLREEIMRFPAATHEQLATQMPYLNAVVQETLRTHPAVVENHRVTMKDDSIPLQRPIKLANGKTVDHIEVSAGMGLIIPIEAMNKSSAFWGPDSHEFKPERWLENELPKKVTEIQGFHHLLTFIDGPRNCIGKNFAVAEFKAAMSVIISSFAFAPLTDGSDIQRVRTLVQRVRNKGYDGLLLRVSRVEDD
ncbi:cytochrome P450 [Dacryopinax primogenitus]|uniref:Cytochrome P450 n=1 Tax=Dacryopinax primogenitus (strain DJM 731) TaxID=1858805 RepID=M5GBY1_DACPD|nr:cytochrome P450 [Dacryopinax primogenitus]EJU05965.1 cytochrome P450 [Dacryopinax primogenitus]